MNIFFPAHQVYNGGLRGEKFPVIHSQLLHYLIPPITSTNINNNHIMYSFLGYFGVLHERNQLYKEARADPHYKSFIDRVINDVMLVCYDSNPEDWFASYRIPHDMDPIILKDFIQRRVGKKIVSLGCKIEVSFKWDSHRKGERLLVVRVPRHRVVY